MADREKLIELLNHDLCKGKTWKDCILCEYYKRSQDCFNVAKADHLIANGVTVQKWVPVTERLPEEHDSIFAKLHGTKKWMPAMFRTISDNVLVCVEYKDGARKTEVTHTKDGEWNLAILHLQGKRVTHWMPLPEPPKGE